MNKFLLVLLMALGLSTNVCFAKMADDNIAGTVLLEKCNYQIVIMPKDNAFSEGLGIVKDEKGNYGYINKDSQVIITPKFSDASLFKDGEATIQYDRFLGRINKNGEFTLEPKYSAVGEFGDGLISVNYPSFYEAYDIKSNKPIKFKDASIIYVSNDYLLVRTNELFGIIDRDGNYMVQPQFTGIYPEKANKFIRVEKKNKVGYITPQGKVIIPISYDNAFIDKNNNFILTKGNETVSVNTPFMKSAKISSQEYNKRYENRALANKKNYYYVKFVLKKEIKQPEDKSKKYVIYRENNKFGIKNSCTNKALTPAIFNRQPIIREDYAYVDVSKPMEFLDKDYKTLLKLNYDIFSASPFVNGKSKVIMWDKKTIKYIDKEGNFVTSL